MGRNGTSESSVHHPPQILESPGDVEAQVSVLHQTHRRLTREKVVYPFGGIRSQSCLDPDIAACRHTNVRAPHGLDRVGKVVRVRSLGQNLTHLLDDGVLQTVNAVTSPEIINERVGAQQAPKLWIRVIIVDPVVVPWEVKSQSPSWSRYSKTRLIQTVDVTQHCPDSTWLGLEETHLIISRILLNVNNRA